MIFMLLAFGNVLALTTMELVVGGFQAEWTSGSSRLGGYFMFCVTLAPTMKYVIMYTISFLISINIFAWRHDKADGLVSWYTFTIVILMFWFVFQKRELRRFLQTEDAKRKERKAVLKQE